MSHRPPMLPPERYLFDIESRWPELGRLVDRAKELDAENRERFGGSPAEGSGTWLSVLSASYAYAKGFVPEEAANPDGTVDASRLPGGSLASCIEAAVAAHAIPDVDDVSLYDAWPSWKAVYRFDEELACELAGSGWADGVPCSDLDRLPAECLYVQAPIMATANLLAARKEGMGRFVGGSPVKCDGFFAWKSDLWLDRRGGRRSVRNLCLRFVTAGGESAGEVLLSLDLDSLEDAIAEDVRYFASQGADPWLEAAFRDQHADLARRACSLLLYLASFSPEIRPAGKTCRQRKAAGSERVGGAELFDVGFEIGSAIRSYRIAGEHRAGAGGRVRPHVRRGYFHHYWTGPRERREKVLRWIHPLVVNEGGGDLATTVRNVPATGVPPCRICERGDR